MLRYKLDLLRHTRSRQALALPRQAWLILRDKLLGARFLIFRVDRATLRDPGPAAVPDLAITPYDRWEEVPAPLRDAIARDLAGEYWGKPRWFDFGWKLWIGTTGGQLAIVTWTRTGAQSQDFCFPLSAHAVLLWQAVTVRAFRGQGLLTANHYHISRRLLEEGCEALYGSCRDYNYPSVKALTRLGFQTLGSCRQRHGGTAGLYYSQAPLFTIG